MLENINKTLVFLDTFLAQNEKRTHSHGQVREDDAEDEDEDAEGEHDTLAADIW